MRKATLVLVAIALAVLLTAVPAHADTFTVNSRNDASDADTANGVCATVAKTCTLRAAIEQANALDGSDTIKFAPEVKGTITLLNGQLAIDSNITIEGPRAKELAVSGNKVSRVFSIGEEAVVEIEGLTIKDGNTGDAGGGIYNDGGTLELSRSTVSGNRATFHGGGIYNLNGTLTVVESDMFGNNVPPNVSGGGIGNENGTLAVTESNITGNRAGQGGGILTQGSAAKATLENTDISDNNATGFGGVGGGIFNLLGTLTLKNSTIAGNSTHGNGDCGFGGGISTVTNGSATSLTNTTISGNSAIGAGGGIYSDAPLTLKDSIVSNNTVARSTSDCSLSNGGGISGGPLTTLNNTAISRNSAESGGGISVHSDTTVTNSTISGNSATHDGGGISVDGDLTLTNSTISGNSATYTGGGMWVGGGYIFDPARLTVTNSTFSGNSAYEAGGIYGADGVYAFLYLRNTIIAKGPSGTGENCRNSIIDRGYNISDDISCSFSAQGSLNDTNPKLAVLADNGGPTQTHALLPESPAINAIPEATNGCGTEITKDQRGVKRPQGEGCDVGSFEKQVVRR